MQVGVFMRYPCDLNGVTGTYNAFITAQADSLWNADREALDQFGERWSGQDSNAAPNVRDWRTQASALEALLAAAAQP